MPQYHFTLPQSRLAAMPARQAGFGLVEILVTMLILTFGLLGIAGLLVNGVANATAAEANTKASQLIADMADRIRANPTEAHNANSKYAINYAVEPATAPTTTAERDYSAWLNALSSQLPGGDGKIDVAYNAAQNSSTVTIEVQWYKCLGTAADKNGDTDCAGSAAATSYATSSMEIVI